MYSINYSDTIRRNVLFSEDEDEFDFKYVPVNEFKHIVKSVKRKRTKDVVKKQCISLAKQQIDRQTNLNDDKTENQSPKTSTFPEKIQTKSGVQPKSGRNALLTIPEESSVLSMNSDSSKSRSSCRNSKVVPLEMAGESCYKFLNYVTNPDSSTNPSPSSKPPRSMEQRLNEVFLQPDLNATYQVLMIQRKISDVLDEISHRLNNVPLPDGENDLQRRHQRIIEFSVRFSRNYLYDLSRQIADIRSHLNMVLENERIQLSKRGLIFHRQTIEHKLVVVHQLLLNALSVYCKHIPTSTLKGQPGKLRDILEMVIELKGICRRVNLTPEYMGFGDGDEVPLGKDTDDKCLAIMSKLKVSSDKDSQLITANSITSALIGMKKRNQKRIQNSLYKYNKSVLMGRKHRMKKTGGMYQKAKKQSIQSATNKMRHEKDSPDKSSSLEAIRISKDFVKNSTKIQVPPKEDDIKTMMDMLETDTDDESNTESPNPVTGIVITKPHEGSTKKGCRSRTSKHGKKDHRFTDQDLLRTVPLISDLMTIIQEKRKQKADKQASAERKSKRDGNQNMQLIHLKEESKAAELNDVSCQVTPVENVKTKKINRIDLSVSEAAKNNLLDYKNAYESYMKSNPLYLNNTKNKPWELMSWVAEKLVDELIVDVSKEFQIEDIINKMFELEFREF